MQGAIRETWRGIVDPENLGVWTRALRGTVDPEGALSQLDTLGGEEMKTWRWERVESRPGYWHGRVILSHDPQFERDGLCAEARAAELMGVPAMFGYGPGSVEILAAKVKSSVSVRAAGLTEEYVLKWEVPDTKRGTLLAVGCAVASSPVLLFERSIVGAAVMIGGAAVAGMLGTAWQAGQQRRAESLAQLNRIRALERSVALKEQRERAAVGFFEGSVIAGRYRLGRKLGAGASGVIHQATRLADNTAVAIKLLRAAVAHDTVASDRLRREAEALGLTWHPNVVEVFEHDHLPDGTAYLVMEELEGESLATTLRRMGTLRAEQIRSIVIQVCDALGAVHAAGVIHRDVKPSNIFLATRPTEATACRRSSCSTSASPAWSGPRRASPTWAPPSERPATCHRSKNKAAISTREAISTRRAPSSTNVSWGSPRRPRRAVASRSQRCSPSPTLPRRRPIDRSRPNGA